MNQISVRNITFRTIRILILGGLILSLFLSKAQSQVFAHVDLNRESVYVQQPFRVTITVYTRTWFTAPLEFGNLQIPGSFIVPFDKTQPGMFTADGKQYPGIQFYYIVFPYKTGTYTVPPIQITAQSPPEGSSQSKKTELQTTPQQFVVKDVPAELKKKGTWFVARDVSLHEKWDHDLKTLKTGDVIKRTITIDAKGTLPQFIPDLESQEETDWAGFYPQEPVLTDTRGNGDANGRSEQTITYLLEKEGDFTIPGVSLSFWNPYTTKIETRGTQPINIHVDENPDLGILATLRDSLDATVKTRKAVAEKGPFLILGMRWYTFAGCLVLITLFLFILFKLVRRWIGLIRMKRDNYRKSETYFFRQFQHSSNEPPLFLNALYQWWDHFTGKYSSSVGETLAKEDAVTESDTFKGYFEKALKHQDAGNAQDIKENLKLFRSRKNKEEKMKKYNYLLPKDGR